jgi:regulatory protein
LAERDYGPDEIEAAVCGLIESGRLDDERFARLYAEDKRELAGWGPERIAAALRDRGIDGGLIDLVCSDGRDEQIGRAAALLGQRGAPLADDRDRSRALGFLTRRGYEYEIAHDAVRAAGRSAAA